MKKILLVIVLIVTASYISNAQNVNGVLIDATNTATRDASAAFQINANTNTPGSPLYGGLLTPQVPLTGTTDVATISGTEANGLLVFNTATAGDVTPGFYYWSTATSVWIRVGSGGSSSNDWTLTGNVGTVDGTNFIGTTDNIPFNIRVNNQKAGRIDHLLSNTGFGYQSLNSGTLSGASNTAYGTIALRDNTTGVGNTAIGHRALQSNTTTNSNTAVGYNSMAGANTGTWNTALGQNTLLGNTSGSYNTALGGQALATNTTGSDNIAIGQDAMFSNTTGGSNVSVGNAANTGNTAGSFNVALGKLALNANVNGSNATAVGYEAMRYANNTTTAYSNHNIAVGFEALRGSTTASDNTGNNNTGIGFRVMRNFTTAGQNTALGYFAMEGATTGSNNTALGYFTLMTNSTGSNNTALGYQAGEGGNANTSGSNNTFIGYSTGFASATQRTNAAAIGYNARVDASNAMVLGGTGADAVNVGMGVTVPDVSAKLDVTATNMGFLPPRVALTSANIAGPVALPATGLMVYNTATAGVSPNDVTPGYYYNSGTTVAPMWTRFGAGSGSVIGGGTTNYLAKWTTTTGLGIGVVYDDATNIGISTTVPSAKLHVNGGNATAAYEKFTAGATTGLLSTDGLNIGIDASGNAEVRQYENLPITFYTNNTSRMVLDNAGILTISGVNQNDLVSASSIKIGNTTATAPTAGAGALRYNSGIEYSDGTNWVALAPTTGTTGYIQNQHAAAQTSSTFWISGVGTFGNGTAALPTVTFNAAPTTAGLFSPGADILGLSTAAIERLRIEANGTVEIGTATQPLLALQTRTTGSPDADRFSIDNRMIVSDVALGADRSIYSIYNLMTNNSTLSTDVAANRLYNYAAWNQWTQGATGKARQGFGSYNYAYNNTGELYNASYGTYSLSRNRGIVPTNFGGYNYALQDGTNTAASVVTSYGGYNLSSITIGTATNNYGSFNQAALSAPETVTLASSYGAYNYSLNNVATATITTSIGAQNYSYNALGNTGTSYGAYNYALANSGTVTTARGSYNRVRTQGTAAITTAYGVESLVENAVGTLSTGYAFYGSLSGTIANKWGVYITGETENYFSGNVGIGVNPSGTYKLEVSGKLLTSGIDENSDIRLKHNINPIYDALSKVTQMRGVTYNWRTEEFPERNFEKDIQFGLIAQELEKIIPELVTTDGDGYKAIEYSHLVPVLIEAIKELEAKNNLQQTTIDTQQKTNNELKASLENVLTRIAALENKQEIPVNKAEK